MSYFFNISYLIISCFLESSGFEASPNLYKPFFSLLAFKNPKVSLSALKSLDYLNAPSPKLNLIKSTCPTQPFENGSNPTHR